MRLIDADKACKALEGFRIKKDTYGSLLNDWDHGYNCGLERAEDEIQDFIVDAIPIDWIMEWMRGGTFAQQRLLNHMMHDWRENNEID